jgi:hypothetical protein
VTIYGSPPIVIGFRVGVVELQYQDLPRRIGEPFKYVATRYAISGHADSSPWCPKPFEPEMPTTDSV